MRRCKWCGVFVPADQPSFTWYRAWGYDGAGWLPDGPPLGWTKPQVLCAHCAESAYNWRSVHHGTFAEVADA
jgi:hypothetical protein